VRQAASEEQMQEWHGSLEEQSEPAQRWQGAVQITTVLVNNLRANLKSVKDTVEKASSQIDEWTATGQGPVESGSTKKYLEKVARATTTLEDVESDLEAWCKTQHTTFKVEVMLLEKKVGLGGNEMNIKTENLLLRRIMKKGLESLEDIKTSFESMQADLDETPEVSKDIGMKTCEKRGSLENWEKGFTVQVATAQDLQERGSLLVARASKDITQMKDVTDHLDVGDDIKDVTSFKTQVLPQLKQLLGLLDNHGENADTI